MPNGCSIHIGVNEPGNCGPKDKLNVCDRDAADMKALASAAGFTPTLLVAEQATVSNVLKAIDDAVPVVGTDGILMLTFSGHGDVVDDLNGDEGDGKDEQWCLADGPLLDDTLREQLAKFQKGARILLISDSCFSGDIFLAPENLFELGKAAPSGGTAVAGEVTAASSSTRHAVLEVPKTVDASVLLMAAASENLTAKEGTTNGLYTGALLKTWNSGNFTGDYTTLHNTIFDALRPRQLPVIRSLVAPSFVDQRPFTI